MDGAKNHRYARRMSAEAVPDLEIHREAVRRHCYRMTGSVHDAEDLTQEVLVRAWKNWGSFRGDAAVTTWLYRIATNVCLDHLKGAKSRMHPVQGFSRYRNGEALPEPPAETLWLEPFPTAEDDLLRREHLSLAFLILLQTLPARQRACLLLCDVLGFPAKDAALSLDLTVAAVNSALQRARKTMAAAERPADVDPAGRREVVAEFLMAWESGDTQAIVALMTDDTTMAMPPIPLWVQGPVDIRRVLDDYPFRRGARHWKLVPTAGANGESALGFYSREGDIYRAWGVQVLVLTPAEGRPVIRSYHVFKGPNLVVPLGLPEILES